MSKRPLQDHQGNLRPSQFDGLMRANADDLFQEAAHNTGNAPGGTGVEQSSEGQGSTNKN